MADACPGQRGSHLVESGGEQQLDIGHPQLLMRLLDDAEAPEQ
jgi:hypothetical protein